MRSRASEALNGARWLRLTGYLVQAVLVAVVSWALLWLVALYASGLRDPRYLDGWILAGGMILQITFHVALKMGALSPRSAPRWRRVHVFLGYLLVPAFLSHSDFTLPDTSFEWALWIGFVLVTLSGIFGIYLSWSLQAKRRIEDGIIYERIGERRLELARQLEAAVAERDPAAAAIDLPGLPHEAWISELHSKQLRPFFQGHRHYASHLIGSQRPLHRLLEEIDRLARFVDQPSKEKLAAIKGLVIDKDALDFAHVYLGLTRGWLFVHVPATYSLIVLTVLHVVIVYAYASGAW